MAQQSRQADALAELELSKKQLREVAQGLLALSSLADRINAASSPAHVAQVSEPDALNRKPKI